MPDEPLTPEQARELLRGARDQMSPRQRRVAQAGATGAGCLVVSYGLALALMALSVLLVVIFVVAVL